MTTKAPPAPATKKPAAPAQPVAPKPRHPDGLEKLIYTAQEAQEQAKVSIRSIQKNAHRALGTGIAGLDGYFAPVLPGQAVAIIGQASHGKSSLLDKFQTAAAEQLMEQDRNEIIAVFSVEETIEEQVLRQVARLTGDSPGALSRGVYSDIKEFDYALGQIGQIPVVRVGYSLSTPQDAPALHLTNMIRCLNFIKKDLFGREVTIAASYFDYLQAFPYDPEIKRAPIEAQRRLQVREDVYRLLDIARWFSCSAWVVVQAKQKLDGALGPNMLLPGQYDGEESSSIGQRFPRVLSCWMEKQTHGIGNPMKYKKLEWITEQRRIWIRVCKQRGGHPSGAYFPFLMDFERNEYQLDGSIA